jgi:hypothetical protein
MTRKTLSPIDVLRASIPEKDFLATVRGMGEVYAWRVYQVLDTANYAKRTSKGWPDLFMVKEGRALAIEGKTEKGRVTPDQQEWIELLATVPGITSGVYRPRDMDELERLICGEA